MKNHLPQGLLKNLSIGKRILLVYYPWERKNSQNNWIAQREFLSEFRANPRDIDYMLAQVSEIIRDYGVTAEFDLFYNTLEYDKLDFPEWLSNIYNNTEISNISENNYKIVISLYPDAIGKGTRQAEKKIINTVNTDIVYILNGRKRIFQRNKLFMRKLIMRRILYSLWWLESLFAIVLFIYALICSGIDMVFPANKEASLGRRPEIQ
ncbi:MAG: hypothetical protein JEZ06_21405 [Anaerolineaceae bacterium]|nr:hypothetical protein [Anaerolineaceae bacterium]